LPFFENSYTCHTRRWIFRFCQDGGRPPSWICDVHVWTTHENRLPWQRPLSDRETNTRLNIYSHMSTNPENLVNFGLVCSEISFAPIKKDERKRKKVTVAEHKPCKFYEYHILEKIWHILTFVRYMCKIWTPFYYMIPCVHRSPKPKRYLDQFSRFCRAHWCDRPTDHATRSVTIGRIYVRSTGDAVSNNKLTLFTQEAESYVSILLKCRDWF